MVCSNSKKPFKFNSSAIMPIENVKAELPLIYSVSSVFDRICTSLRVSFWIRLVEGVGSWALKKHGDTKLPDAFKMFVTEIPLYFLYRTSAQVGDLSSSEDFNRYHTCLFCNFKTETAVGMAGHYRQSHADLLELAHKRPQNDEEPSTSQLSPMKQCGKCSYASRSFESLLAHVENEHGTKIE